MFIKATCETIRLDALPVFVNTQYIKVIEAKRNSENKHYIVVDGVTNGVYYISHDDYLLLTDQK